MPRRTAGNRAVEAFLKKYPQYGEKLRLHGTGYGFSFNGFLYKASAEFRPYTERAKIWGWLNECRRTDELLLKRKEEHEIKEKQGTLI